MFTLSTQIPTSSRGQIRALVKAHPAWPAFLVQYSILSASARNTDLIVFALRHPALAAQIEQILQSYATAAPKESAAVLILANRIERLLTAYASRRNITKPRIRVRAISQPLTKDEEALDDFNYVGSRHHY